MAVHTLTDKLQSQIAGERSVVAERLEALKGQSQRLHAMTDRVDDELTATQRLLRQMDELLGVAPQLAIDSLSGELRGQRLREVAVAVLRKNHGVGAVVHYRDWYDLVVAEGGEIAGKDPVATFLTQIARAAEVESVRPRSGLYRLLAS